MLRAGAFSCPWELDIPDETYTFSAGIHLDPQNLPRRRAATLILRPDWRIHGIPLDPARLGPVTVTLAAVDARGTRTERVFEATFERGREWTANFYVPDDIRLFKVSVKAKVRRQRDLQEIELTDSRTFDVNQDRASDVWKQLYLLFAREGWRVELRGLAGEPIAGIPLSVTLHRPEFARPLTFHVMTDAGGRVDLGPLDGISRVHIEDPDGLVLDRSLEGGAAVWPSRLHVLRGEMVSLPWSWDRRTGLPPCSLFQVRGDTILADFGDAVTIESGELRIAGLPPGDYLLQAHDAGASVRLHVVEGDVRAGYLWGRQQRLQQTPARLPSVADVQVEGTTAIIRLRHVTPSTRVAVRAHRLLDRGSEFPLGAGIPEPARWTAVPPAAVYVSGVGRRAPLRARTPSSHAVCRHPARHAGSVAEPLGAARDDLARRTAAGG